MARAHCWWSDSMQQAWVLQDEPKRQNSANISSQVREIDIFNEQKMGPDDKVANEMATIIPLTLNIITRLLVNGQTNFREPDHLRPYYQSSTFLSNAADKSKSIYYLVTTYFKT